MMGVPVITGWLNVLVLALTPGERWEALGRFNSNFTTEYWFILTGLAAIIILTAVLFAITYNRTVQQQKAADGLLFAEYAEKRGLSGRERQILLNIAKNARLKRNVSIFTMSKAFDRGVTKMMEESLAQQGVEENTRLKADMSCLREKLAFQSQPIPSIGPASKSKKLSSRQILVGKKVHITRRTAHTSDDIESTVIKNNDMELTVKLTMPVKITFGDSWRVRYYFGASVWEFDTSVVSYDGDVLVLNHSDEVRFINRRRFLRVPVSNPAFVARFPFTRVFAGNSNSSEEGFKAKQISAGDKQGNSGDFWGLPEFVPAVVTELAGPGLRIETTLEVNAGERVLVVFRLDEREDQNSIPLRREGKTPTSKIVEDIGEVRHTKAIQNGLSIAVELTGLSDSNVNELIRAANAASVRAGAEGQDVSSPAGNKQGAEEQHVSEPAAVQGV